MEFSYLGRYAAGKVNVSIYLASREQVVVSVLLGEDGALVQAFKKLALRGGHLKKGVDLSALHSVASAHSATFELVTTRPSSSLVERLTPLRESATKWLERTLEKLDSEIVAAKDEYARWRGVRDLDEAHENLANRREEIFDLNQKLIANAREPSFVYSPTKWIPSEWQRTDRVRFHELKDQAKEKVSSLRSRIDFTYRDRIKQLEEKRRELVQDIEAERKKDAQHAEHQTSILEESMATALLLSVRSRPIFTTRPVAEAVRSTAREVHREAAALRTKLAEHLGLDFDEADEASLLSPIMVPDARAPARTKGAARDLAEAIEGSFALAPRLTIERETAKVVAQLLKRPASSPSSTGELSKFPRASDKDKQRLIYLGRALDEKLVRTDHIAFYDLDVLTRHSAVSGGSGSGKSVAARLLVEGAALHGVPSVIFDPTRSWTGMATACTGSLLKRYEAFEMDPGWARAFELRILDVEPFTSLDAAELLAYKGLSILPAWTLTAEQEQAVATRLLQGVQREIVQWPETSTLRALLVFEEAHRYLQGGDLEAMLELLTRTARAKGLGLIFVSQNNVDLPPGVRNNTATRLQMQTAYGPDLTRAAQTFGSEYAKKIPARCGVIHYPEYGAALVAFRPPLCSPHALSENVVRFYQVCRNLSDVTRKLLAQPGLPDGAPWTADSRPDATASETKSRENETMEAPRGKRTTDTDDDPPGGRPARTWRQAAETHATRDMTSVTLAAALRRDGIEPPSERTLRRFLRERRGIHLK